MERKKDEVTYYGIERYKLLCIKYKKIKDMLYSTRNNSHYFVLNFNGV